MQEHPPGRGDLRKQADMAETTPDAAARKREYMRQYRKANRAKLSEQARQYRAANLEKSRERERKYAAANREKRRERNRRYYQENRDEIRDRQRSRQDENRDYLREYKRQYYAKNKAKISESVRRYRAANPERVSQWNKRRRAADPEAYKRYGLKYAHGLDEAARAAMWQRQRHCCYLCGNDLDLASACVEHWHGCPGHDPKRSCPVCRRGLACHQCNIIIGLADEDPDRLRMIAGNLEAANRDLAARQVSAPQQLMLE